VGCGLSCPTKIVGRRTVPPDGCRPPAAQGRGLTITRVEVDPKTSRIVLVVKGDDDTETAILNPFDDAPVQDPALKRRKTKTP
jgi:hypothetical protein